MIVAESRDDESGDDDVARTGSPTTNADRRVKPRVFPAGVNGAVGGIVVGHALMASKVNRGPVRSPP